MGYRDGRSANESLPKLLGLRRCPHCGIAHPVAIEVWHSGGLTPRADGRPSRTWAVSMCISCGSPILIGGHKNYERIDHIDIMFPKLPDVAEELPERARTYLQQAHDTKNAPDASALMCAAAVDAMLKEKGYIEGSIYARINKARDERVLTSDMAEWAHHVRLEANRPRHADSHDPHVSPEEASACLDFAEALGNFLFVITARVTRGLTKAKEVEGGKKA